jgi:hypothetical protein
MEITREQLVDALQEFHLWVTPDPAYKDVGRRCVVGTVQDPESMADGLLLALRANAAHEDDDVVDAHICCEHAADGPYVTRASYELRMVDQIVALLDHRGQRVTRRVLRWVWDYLTDDDEPPF